MADLIGLDRALGPVKIPAPFPQVRKTGGPDQTPFGDMFKSFIKDVNQLQNKSGATIEKFIAGDIKDAHQVMLAMGEAKMALNLLLEVRNKAMEAYREILNMRG